MSVKIDRKTRTYLILFLFVVGIIISFITGNAAINNKRIFDIDESLSMALANEQRLGWVVYETRGWFTQDFFKRYIVTDHPFSYHQVFLNQAEDVHPPLYYLLLHTVYSMHTGSSSVSHALNINLFFFLINCTLIYWFIHRNTNSILMPLTGMLIYATNPIILQGLILIRMYQMVSTFSLMFLFAGTEIVFHKLPFYPLLLISVLLGGLTHYYFYLVMACMSLAFGIVLICQKRFKPLLLSVIHILAAACLNFFVIFPATHNHLFSDEANGGHGAFARDAIKEGLSSEKINAFLGLTYGGKIVFLVSVIAAVSALIFLLIVKISKVENTRLQKKALLAGSIIILAYAVYFLLISQVATYRELRYLLPGEVIGICGLCLILGAIPYEIGCVPAVLIGILCFDMTVINGYKDTIPSSRYAEEHSGPLLIVMDERVVDNQLGVCYLDFLQYPSVGMAVIGEDLKNDIREDFTVYYSPSLDLNDVEEYVRNLVDGSLSFTEHPEAVNTSFQVLEVSRGGN